MDDMIEEVIRLTYEPPKSGKKKIRNPDSIDLVIRACMADPKYSDCDYGRYVADHGLESVDVKDKNAYVAPKICECCGKTFRNPDSRVRFCSVSCGSRQTWKKRKGIV